MAVKVVEIDDFQNTDNCQNIPDLISAVNEHHRIIIRELSEESNNSHGSVQSILYAVQSILYAVQSILYAVQSILYAVQSILYAVQSILYAVQFIV
ncbi:hypothetical protein AVEN_160355-1 [Araneus ventricosus]|uniref:Uncharacterized protein n=1 Tax=Araneus ventricosus TaxID=182803 RepID=A0A4Y1ZRK0_ARAVE|nr:hypothetical protein AVEN_189985-1 [Araneus ventricosus]GBL64557.1 hypothetical protein AVEN_65900-1 [Araneus ventricosus]GBL64603.1 hypothetical protein AVEN_89761-1 [Araneus ventricosus]GBL64720.1 hypothetical protein AVEN_160355-1 [Araneus ventricosus]